MTENSPSDAARVFAKAEAGLAEIKTRALCLPAKMRSVLIMVDGQRNVRDLVGLTGSDIEVSLHELLSAGCIVEVLTAKPTVAPTAVVNAAPAAPVNVGPSAADDLAGLPPASSRSAKQVDMARNFMTNTVNTMFGANMRISMIEAIFNCRTADDLRAVYPQWVETMTGSVQGTRRLPELRQKLFDVL